ncbi:MAG: methylase RsmC [Planctomycetaceae bacterium]|nr:methylase RsmC [Planctomycetaceae bacterium]
MSNVPPPAQLAQLMFGFWASQAVYVAAKLDLAGLIKDGSKNADELAQATSTHAHSLYRLLRMLASLGVLAEDSASRFSLTAVGQCLRENVPGSQRALALMAGEEHYQSWGDLMYSIQTGLPAFDKLYGQPIFDWLSQHPEQAAIFDQAMVSVHGRETAAMLDAYDFKGIKTLADVGGGNGSLLMATLQRNPHLRGMLYDLPGVIERATPQFEAAGLTSRCRLISGSFFEAIPTGADAYLMRHIIHDWTDEQCLTILRHIHKAMPADGRLLVVESVIPPGNDPFFGKQLDLNMLVIPGGQERTAAEYEQLFAAAGFKLARIVPTTTEISIVEGVK